ncbi:MAG TPA: NADH-quinone oxidoreductase subunit D [Sphingobacteriaceae bacterium]|nr:NADH-quinone oxidoreductase subunit D [Sphingobacteriaceae bacterium]
MAETAVSGEVKQQAAQPAERELFLNMGPQHPSTHGVLRLKLRVDGERVLGLEPDIGYLHRCFEKIAERRQVTMVIPYTDRTDYLAAITSEWAYVMAAEKLMGVEVPERAEYIRVIVGEMQRLASHLLWFGTFALDLGATTAFLYAFRERESLFDIFQKLTGARMLYNYLRVGGVRNDLYDGFADDLLRFLDVLEDKLREYNNLLTGNRIFETRTKGVGVITAEQAIAYGASGPVLRGSGVPYDLRKVDPYSVYDRFEFGVPVGEHGDVYSRYVVRMQEFYESIKIIRQALRDIPDGPWLGDVPRRMKLNGDAYARVESPRGEVGVYLVGDGTDQPYRCHYRSPCFVHLQLLEPMGVGHLIADMVAIIGSIDIVMGEVDR